MSGHNTDNLRPQVQRAHYYSSSYLGPGRMASYSYQMREVLTLTPSNVLEIGIGNGMVAYALRQGGTTITTLDFDATLCPSVVASVTHLPLGDDLYDVVTCFEVLEHVPWHMVPMALREVHRVCRKYAVISLPDVQPVARVYVSRVLQKRLFTLPLWRIRRHKFDGQHYWEIGTEGHTQQDVVDCMTRVGFRVRRTFRPWEASGHRFFSLEKAD